tara:strand:- start:236 stop:553 length:318 start_codon:yes stop_codon:yes gene_type:complete
MANTVKVLSRAAASLTTTTVLYTVPAATSTVVTNIAVVNTAATAATFTLGMGVAAGQVALHTTTAIAANSTIYIDLKQVLLTTNTITGGASAITVSFHISGVEVA